MIYNQIKKRLYFIPVFIYTFIKLKSNKRGKVMPTIRECRRPGIFRRPTAFLCSYYPPPDSVSSNSFCAIRPVRCWYGRLCTTYHLALHLCTWNASRLSYSPEVINSSVYPHSSGVGRGTSI